MHPIVGLHRRTSLRPDPGGTWGLRVGRLKSALPIVLCWLALGCGNSDPKPVPNAAPPLKGTTVEIAAPPDLRLSSRWGIQLDEWMAESEAVARLNETESDDATPPDSAALAIVPLSSIPALVDADWIAPIENAQAEADWEETLRGVRNGIAQPGGRPALIPTACPVLVCYYRVDLLEAAGQRPPETWEQYQTLLETLGAWSGGLLACEPWGPEFRSTMLLARAAGYALHPDNVSILLDLQDASPLIAGPAFVQALEASGTAFKLLDPKSRKMSPEDCCQAVLEGRAAIAVGCPPAADEAVATRSTPSAVVATIKLPGASRIFDRSSNRWTQPPDGSPSRVTLVGFRGYAACASAKIEPVARDAAWQLWASLRQNSGDDDLPFGPAVCRARDVPAAARKVGPGFTPAEWRQHVETAVAVLQDTRVLLDFPLPDAERFRDALAAHIDAALDDKVSPAEALQQAAADWTRLIDEIGRERVLSVYRRCHALAPK